MRISLITPSFNKGAYLEACLNSVLGQGFRDLEYGVVDKLSTDETPEILDRFRDRLSFVLQESDDGMYEALNKGFANSRGEIMGYLGSDDLHLPWTLSVVAEVFERFPQIEWITSQYPLTADAEGRVLRARRLEPPSAAAFFRGLYLPGHSWWSAGWIQQESTFWRRSLWERAGGFDSTLKLAGDFDLWCRFMKLSEPLTLATPLAAFRRHGKQISSTQQSAYGDEALTALQKHGGKPDGAVLSRARQALIRLGWQKSGPAASFDFAQGRWRQMGF
jgi:glycosyltransferase involved in cell wall biosynthesis